MGRFTAGGFALKAVTAGADVTCGLTSAGKAYCWGYNQYGSLGDGTTDNSNVPVPVDGGLIFSAISTEGRRTCGLSGGRAYCWGLVDGATISNTPLEVPGDFTFSSITATTSHACALTRDGVAYCWGKNDLGQLGDGTNSDSFTPVVVAGGFTFASLSAARDYTCGITRAGQALCWGSGNLGNGLTWSTRSTPGLVSTARLFTAISAGAAHTCGLAKGGEMLCWGDDLYGQLGDGDGSPDGRGFPAVAAPGMTFVSLGVGGVHTCGIVRGGKAYCWGLNTNKQLGAGMNDVSSGVPLAVAGGFAFTSLDLGGAHSCGITKDRGTWCWGYNDSGAVGSGTYDSPVATPSAVVSP